MANGVSQVFRWDGEDRLVGYSNSEAGVSASYYYDPFGRRLRKVVNGVTNWYVYADEGLVEEMDGQGNEILSYGYAPNSLWMNDPVYMRVPGVGTTNIYYFLNDHLGAPQKLIAKNGEVAWSIESEAFGEAAVSSDSTITNHLRFSSQYFDEESGLHYNTQRYYGPERGRYLSRDPEGEYADNLYCFIQNSPLVHVDPLGLVTYDFQPQNVQNAPYGYKNMVPRMGGYLDIVRLDASCSCQCCGLPDMYAVRCTIAFHSRIVINSQGGGASGVYGHEQRHMLNLLSQATRIGDSLRGDEKPCTEINACTRRSIRAEADANDLLTLARIIEGIHGHPDPKPGQPYGPIGAFPHGNVVVIIAPVIMIP